MIESIRVLSWWSMDRMRRKEEVPSNAAIISILSPPCPSRLIDPDLDRFDFECEPIFNPFDLRVCTVRFFDTAFPEEHEFPSISMTQAHAIIEFLGNIHFGTAMPRPLFVHCAAGVSRGGAVGEVAAIIAKIPWETFKRANPQVQPNAHVKAMLMRAWRGRMNYHVAF